MFNLRKPTQYDFQQGLERGGRAFVAAAIAIYPAQNLVDQLSTGQGIDIDLAKKAIFAGTLAVIMLLWRWLLPDVGRSKPDVVADPAVPPDEYPPGAEGVPAPPVDDVPAPDEVA